MGQVTFGQVALGHETMGQVLGEVTSNHSSDK